MGRADLQRDRSSGEFDPSILDVAVARNSWSEGARHCGLFHAAVHCARAAGAVSGVAAQLHSAITAFVYTGRQLGGRMVKKTITVIGLLLLLSLSAAAQDAKAILSNVSKAMGAEGVNSVMYYGSGAN